MLWLPCDKACLTWLEKHGAAGGQLTSWYKGLVRSLVPMSTTATLGENVGPSPCCTLHSKFSVVSPAISRPYVSVAAINLGPIALQKFCCGAHDKLPDFALL